MTPDAQIGLGHGHDIGGMLARADLAMNVASRCKSITGRHSDIRCTATTGIRNRHPAVLLARAWRGVLAECMRIFGGRAMDSNGLQVSGARAGEAAWGHPVGGYD
jgi:hypothetical protein